jgi:soluble lytic murein transglycosylase
MRWVVVAFVSIALLLGPGAAAMAGSTGPAVSAEAPSALRLSAELRDRFAAALVRLRAGDVAEPAREFADPVWATTPLNEYALLFRAESLLRAGDAAGARAAALRAADGAPDGYPPPSALLQEAGILSSAGDDAGAASLYRRFLDRHADHLEAPRARYALARALLAAGRVPEASRAFGELWLVAPTSPEAEAAARQLRVLDERGLGGSMPTPRKRIERAERLLAAGLVDAARTEADALLQGGLPIELAGRALKIVADGSRRAGRHDAALAAVNRALGEMPPGRRAPWLLELARLQQRRSREAALATLDKLVEDHPKSPEAAEALLSKARLLEGAAKSADAEAAYQRLAAAYPSQEEAGTALWRLGWFAWFRGAYADAASRWARLSSIRGGQAHREAAAYWIGRAHEQRGEVELAGRQFAQIQADAPRSYYGILAARRGVRGAVLRAPAGAGPVLPADPLQPLQADARFARVEALRAVGLPVFADEELEELTRGSLGEPRLLYALSAVYARESRYDLALRILRRHFQTLARSGLASLPRTFWEMFYPFGWRAELTEAAGRAAVDPLLVAAVVREESSFHAHARSRVGARGLMQLMPETARPLAQARRLPFNNGDLLDEPAANLEMGAAFFAGLLREFGDARLAVAGYNAGPARVREWWGARRSDDLEVFVEEIPFNETRAFVKRVMLSWDEYRRLYGSGRSSPLPAVDPVSARP